MASSSPVDCLAEAQALIEKQSALIKRLIASMENAVVSIEVLQAERAKLEAEVARLKETLAKHRCICSKCDGIGALGDHYGAYSCPYCNGTGHTGALS